MSDSRKKFEESHKFWEEQDFEKPKRDVYITPRVAGYIIDRALMEVKDVSLAEDLESLKEWIVKTEAYNKKGKN